MELDVAPGDLQGGEFLADIGTAGYARADGVGRGGGGGGGVVHRVGSTLSVRRGVHGSLCFSMSVHVNLQTKRSNLTCVARFALLCQVDLPAYASLTAAARLFPGTQLRFVCFLPFLLTNFRDCSFHVAVAITWSLFTGST